MIRLALLGCDGAASAYVGARPRLRGATFVAAVDADPEKAGRTARALGASLAAASLDELIERHADAFDAVVVCTPNSTHATMVRGAAAAGKHALVETPLALSTREADAAIKACRSAGVRLMVGQAMRFMESLVKVKDGVASGKLGAPGLLRVHRWESLGGAGWRHPDLDGKGTGGTVMCKVVREIDLALWLFERLPTTVYAVARKQANANLDVPDYVQAHLGFPEGGMALIDYSMTLPRGSGYFSLSLIGSSGAAYADDHHNMNLLYRGGEPLALNTGQGEAHIRAQLQEFINAVEEGREPAIAGAQGRDAVLVAEAAVASAASGSPLTLDGGRYGHI